MPADLDALARHVIDVNRYMTLATVGPDGRPRVSPVYYAPVRYRELYWVSSPASEHSANLTARPQVEIVIFDSTAPLGAGEAVYLSATAGVVGEARPDAELDLYVAHVSACDVHVPGGHPVHGRGIDSRQAADPTAA